MRASLNGKETQNLAVAYPGDIVGLYFDLPDEAEMLKFVGAKLRILPLTRGIGTRWCAYHGRPYADAWPNLCAPGPASEACAWDHSSGVWVWLHSTHRPRWPNHGSVITAVPSRSAITAHCRKGRAPRSEHPSPKLPSTDCTVT